jgi:hypothetical protein
MERTGSSVSGGQLTLHQISTSIGKVFLGGGEVSHQVPNVFPKFPKCSPTCSPFHLTFIPYALANVVLLSLA